jgi:aspartate aminotransferase-like enzyme
MENRFFRHNQIARAFRAGLLELRFSLFTQEPFLADTLSVVYYPEGIEDKSFRKGWADNGVVVAGGLGEVVGKVFRMGHMGNLSFSQVIFALTALENSLSTLSYDFEPECGVKVARKILGT